MPNVMLSLILLIAVVNLVSKVTRLSDATKFQKLLLNPTTHAFHRLAVFIFMPLVFIGVLKQYISGENAECTERNGVARCTCIPPYIGDAYTTGCRPECVFNADCPSNLACIKQYCRDPCRGVCGQNAECSVVNHIPVCTCERGYQGDPFTGCRMSKFLFFEYRRSTVLIEHTLQKRFNASHQQIPANHHHVDLIQIVVFKAIVRFARAK